jgi:hypothetical protein
VNVLDDAVIESTEYVPVFASLKSITHKNLKDLIVSRNNLEKILKKTLVFTSSVKLLICLSNDIKQSSVTNC